MPNSPFTTTDGEFDLMSSVFHSQKDEDMINLMNCIYVLIKCLKKKKRSSQ